jgi:hypothetical protein
LRVAICERRDAYQLLQTVSQKVQKGE